MAEGWGETSDWLSKFCKTSTIKLHLSMAEGRGEASTQFTFFLLTRSQKPYLSMGGHDANYY